MSVSSSSLVVPGDAIANFGLPYARALVEQLRRYIDDALTAPIGQLGEMGPRDVVAVAPNVDAVLGSLRGVMTGPAGQQRLEDIVENVRTITTQVRDLIAANRTNVDSTVANARVISESLRFEIPRLAASLDRMATQMTGTVGENRQDVRQIVENLRSLSADLKTTSDNLNAVTAQVRSGEGTVGKLLYSDEAHDRLTAALGSVESGVTELRNTLGRVSKMQLDLGLNGDYYAGLPSHSDGGD